MKKQLIFILALLLPVAASAYDACINGIYYNIVKKAKQATVTYGESESGTYSGNVNIPATVDYDGVTCNVITIDKNAFRGCTLASLTIPASITSIEEYAFYYSSINQLHINDLAAWCSTNLGYGSSPFSCSEHLYVNGKEVTDLVIPDGVTKINDHAFERAKMLKTIYIPGSVTEIGSYAFSTNYQGALLDYDKVTIDNRNLVAIGDKAFRANIKELHITDLAAWCSNVMFYNESAWENYGASRAYQYNNPLETSEKFFVNGKEIKDLVILSGVTKITPFAFYGAKMLTSVSIPNSVKEIGAYAFEGCTSLKSANIPDEVEVIDHSFAGCSSLKDLTIGRSVRKMFGVLEYKGNISLESLENIYISDLTSYCKIVTSKRSGSSRDLFVRAPKKNPMKADSNTKNVRLFLNGKEVKDLVVPNDIFDTMDMVEYYNFTPYYYICDAFYGISSLESVTLPEGTIPDGIDCRIGGGYNAGFRNCPNLKYIKNESNLGRIDIMNCDKMETLFLGKHTGWCNVYSCKELSDVYCDGTPNGAHFSDDCQVEHATLHVPEILIEKYRTFTLENAAGYSFYKYFGSIVALKPGDPGYMANPDNTAITFADAVFGAAAIANWDFDGDGKLSKYEASLVTDFGEAFKGNTSIKSTEDLKYFTSMNTINDNAFYRCTSLISATIPNFVKCIGRNAFWGCEKLTAVYISDLPAWCGIYFRGDESNPLRYAQHLYLNGNEVKDLNIPNSVKSIGDYAFYGCSELTSVSIPNSVTNIGSYAFSRCSGMKEVHSKIKVPFAIESSVFPNYNIPLYVPRGTKALYEASVGWKNFQTIIETDFNDQPQGDVNGDGKVDVADIASVISVMAKGNNDKVADVNGDGKVDVADIATVIDIMAANARQMQLSDGEE